MAKRPFPEAPDQLAMLKTIRVLVAALAVAAVPAGAGEPLPGPVPPCGGAPAWPPFPAPGAPPATMIWRAADPAALAWTPPDCTGWPPSARSRLVAALAGSFRFEGSQATLLARIGAVSSLPAMRYWSTTAKAWRPMARQAAALASADPHSRRPDFAAAEFIQGRMLYYWVDDPWTGQAVYRLRVLERQGERVVIASENVSPVRFLFITLFQPGTLQAVEFLERAGPDRWQVYLLARIDRQASRLLWNQAASSLNRLVALYRRLADIPTDREPFVMDRSGAVAPGDPPN